MTKEQDFFIKNSWKWNILVLKSNSIDWKCFFHLDLDDGYPPADDFGVNVDEALKRTKEETEQLKINAEVSIHCLSFCYIFCRAKSQQIELIWNKIIFIFNRKETCLILTSLLVLWHTLGIHLFLVCWLWFFYDFVVSRYFRLKYCLNRINFLRSDIVCDI